MGEGEGVMIEGEGGESERVGQQTHLVTTRLDLVKYVLHRQTAAETQQHTASYNG